MRITVTSTITDRSSGATGPSQRDRMTETVEGAAAIRRFAPNSQGRDFVVGDIHGCFSILARRLDQIRFDADRDRLFSVGDLIDRGPDSKRALLYLGQLWFHAVRGNHEQMAMDFSAGALDAGLYAVNGGRWFIDLPPAERAVFADAFRRLPVVIEIETPRGLVGIIHADCPASRWPDLARAFLGPERAAWESACLWSRDRIDRGADEGVEGVRAVVVGHTPLPHVTRLGNVIYIDTGAVFGGELTILDLTDI
jgi:serine/threonine protein phosphatase 1